MSIKIIGTNSSVEVDTDGSNKMFVSPKPPAFGAGGAFSLGVKTGSLAATIAAGSPLFSARWASASLLALIERITISALTNSTITTAVNVDFDVMIARAFTASDSGGTSVLPTSNSNKRRTSMAASAFTDMRIASTAALTPGTRVLDSNPVSIGPLAGTGTTAPSNWFPQFDCVLWDAYMNGAFHPLILAQNEGLLVRNNSVGPATGTWVLRVRIDWMEVASY